MADVMDADVIATTRPADELGEREELTERGVVEKVVHPAHGRMDTLVTARLLMLGVPAECIFDNVRLSRNPNGTRYVPDLFVVRATNPVQPLDDADYEGVPDLVIEILSPGDDDRARDLDEKRRAYAARGVPAYWIADPYARTITDGYRQAEWVSLDQVTLPW
jgi:Uma2 family endonuclease